MQAARLSRARNVRRRAELDSGSCRPFGEALGDQSCSFSRGAGVGHHACLSGLGPTAGWEVEPVLPRGLPSWGEEPQWLFRQEASGTKAALRPELPGQGKRGIAITVALIWPAAGGSPPPRARAARLRAWGCRRDELGEPRPHTGGRCHVLLSFIAWTPKHIHLAKLLNVWKGNLPPALTEPAVQFLPANPTAPSFFYVLPEVFVGGRVESRLAPSPPPA